MPEAKNPGSYWCDFFCMVFFKCSANPHPALPLVRGRIKTAGLCNDPGCHRKALLRESNYALVR